MLKRILYLSILISVFSTKIIADTSVLYFNNIARPLGLGGAFTAVSDFEHNHLYNPASTVFFNTKKITTSASFDAIRFAYFFISLIDEDKNYGSESTAEDEKIGAAALAALLLSTSQFIVGNKYFQFKINFMDQLPTKGIDYPMYVSTLTAAVKFGGPLTGFQIGLSTHFYNIAGKDPSGNGLTLGLHYRPGNISPFSFGIFYFTVDNEIGEIRKPFERIMNNTINLGITYEIFNRFTLNFDLRNVNNIDLGNYYQPHFGLEKVFNLDKDNLAFLILRAGSYYSSETDNFGYSFGFELKFNFKEKAGPRIMKSFMDKVGSAYLSYSFTSEKDLVPANYNHIISIGFTL